jgi:hypothetical protein
MILTITTKYKGPTNTQGSKFRASGFGKSITLPYDYELNSFENHQRVAQALIDREKIKGNLKVSNDELKTGYRFIVEVEQMQTFLPYPSFSESAKVLDNKRLGKQRVEAYQILRVLCGESTGWQHHPAVKMWKGFEWALWSYGQDICIEWIRRGFKDTVLTKLEGMEGYKVIGETRFKKPSWLHDTARED